MMTTVVHRPRELKVCGSSGERYQRSRDGSLFPDWHLTLGGVSAYNFGLTHCSLSKVMQGKNARTSWFLNLCSEGRVLFKSNLLYISLDSEKSKLTQCKVSSWGLGSVTGAIRGSNLEVLLFILAASTSFNYAEYMSMLSFSFQRELVD